ncbi:MAG: flagellar assembly protein FliW [Actinomycetota bacterium]|jgi:flagellar assembly factor FliW|nr:flagellar assembly protein FliW [Actinomycetota bacterium]
MNQLRVTPIATIDPDEGTPADGADAGPLAVGEDGAPVEITFASGLPGFDDLRRFVVEPLGPELAPFCRLRCLDRAGVEFIVVPPGLLFPDYAVEVDDDVVARLELAAEDAVVLTIVTLAEGGRVPTANLLGPLVINRRTRAGAQVVQHGSGYEVAVPLVSPGA